MTEPAQQPSPPVLAYADAGTPRPPPRPHSPLVGWAWAAVVVEVVYKGSVIAYAHHRSPTYPWERFAHNVGDPLLFVGIDCAILLTGAILAAAALVPRRSKRWAAWGALAANLSLLAFEGGLSLMLELASR